MTEYSTLRLLQIGQIIDLQGIRLEIDTGEIRVGDLYIAERNTGPKLLTAKKIVMLDDESRIDFVIPTCGVYCYNAHDCVKVREA